MIETTLDDGWTVPSFTVGEGPPIVLVLGSVEAVRSAAAVAADAAAGHRVVAVDVADLASDPAETTIATGRLLALLASLGVRDATLVGHTVGCAVAAHAARTAPAGVISRLALISSPVVLPAASIPSPAADYATDLGHVTVPTLVLHSETDPVSPVNDTALGAAIASPNAQLRVYPGVREALSAEQRDAVIRDLLAFADAASPL
ncbi:MAG: hypothetical protein BGO45_15640 [Microbacterium sp. 71-36]|uniref:alpha/beta fold hydrolase n=1 Tax=unclassified Microbacterium TaxID=2609290 RepID=UPI00086AC3D4|nr:MULTISPECIES: alpha/beta hydrolase [unclassified Microbacterium]MBN9212376.1 alpha/beta hydrolase [Microbacterium sp.]ODT38684.1 MAG: hypothetical protein ABS60_09635 [Microbacterium sp. SCN 71-17]OJV78105.1 MAG: hypothetical protein BGO45_15640 [Microbacterium sp. 71-36]